MGKNRSGEMPTTGKSQKLKIISSVWLGKAMMALTRLLGRGGTTLPGRAALRLYPGLLPYLAGHLRHGSLLVTGTNGKTTTAALLTGILRKAGYRCIYNQSGSNMAWGVTSSLIGASSWGGKLPGDLAVMEVDEGAFPALVKILHPRGMVLTNIFSDQLDRYGEIDAIQKAIGKGLEAAGEGSFQVINADDPSLAGIEGGSRASVYFGLNWNWLRREAKTRRVIANHARAAGRSCITISASGAPGPLSLPSLRLQAARTGCEAGGLQHRRGATALELLVRRTAAHPLPAHRVLQSLQCPRCRYRSRGHGRAGGRDQDRPGAPPSFGRMECLLKGAAC